jgi:signal transduction histidine kinase
VVLGVSVASLRDANGVVFGISTVLHDVTASKHADEVLSNLSRRLMDAQEQERRRIARELHDDIGQRLATLAINLGGQVELQRQVADLASDVQALSHQLHSSRIELLGLTVAMRHFCGEFATQQKFTVDFDSADLPEHLPPDVSHCLFRILQESLHNAAKHSGDRAFVVRLRGAQGAVHLEVVDRGKGFDVTRARTGRGIGLVSMEERLKLVAGDLWIESIAGRGTAVRARVPVTA